MRRQILGIAVLAAAAAVAGSAPPEKDFKVIAEKFEKAVKDAEVGLKANLEKAAAKAKDKDKVAAAKIAYEAERFDKYRELPSSLSNKESKDYLRARDAAVAALTFHYDTQIKALRAAKKTATADEFEHDFGRLLKAARGFGLAVPDPGPRPFVVIRAKDGDAVLEPLDPRKSGTKIALTKYVRGKQSQLWTMERGEDGLAFRAVLGNGLYLHVPGSSTTEGEQLMLYVPGDRPPNVHYCWKADEQAREVILASSFNGLAMATKEVTEKGVLRTLLVQEKKPNVVPSAQVWKIEVPK